MRARARAQDGRPYTSDIGPRAKGGREGEGTLFIHREGESSCSRRATSTTYCCSGGPCGLMRRRRRRRDRGSPRREERRRKDDDDDGVCLRRRLLPLHSLLFSLSLGFSPHLRRRRRKKKRRSVSPSLSPPPSCLFFPLPPPVSRTRRRRTASVGRLPGASIAPLLPFPPPAHSIGHLLLVPLLDSPSSPSPHTRMGSGASTKRRRGGPARRPSVSGGGVGIARGRRTRWDEGIIARAPRSCVLRRRVRQTWMSLSAVESATRTGRPKKIEGIRGSDRQRQSLKDQDFFSFSPFVRKLKNLPRSGVAENISIILFCCKGKKTRNSFLAAEHACCCFDLIFAKTTSTTPNCD